MILCFSMLSFQKSTLPVLGSAPDKKKQFRLFWLLLSQSSLLSLFLACLDFLAFLLLKEVLAFLSIFPFPKILGVGREQRILARQFWFPVLLSFVGHPAYWGGDEHKTKHRLIYPLSQQRELKVATAHMGVTSGTLFNHRAQKRLSVFLQFVSSSKDIPPMSHRFTRLRLQSCRVLRSY